MLLVSASRAPSRPSHGVIAAIASGLIVTLTLGLWRAGLTDVDVWTAIGEWQPLEQRSTVHAADGTVLAVLHDVVDRRVVELEDIPTHVRQAVLVAEDRRFYDHAGYDSRAVARAVLTNVREGEVRQGGSTITQQLAKQNFVGSETSLRRKVKELAYALMLERSHSKDELLERYLNQVYFGAGAYGIAAAAEEFFRVEPDQLTVPQAAMLAGMIRSPGRLDPRRWPDAAKTRRDHLLASMAANGDLHRRDLAGLQNTPIDPSPPLVQAPRQPHLVEAVKREFLANPAFGATMAERIDLLFSGGLHIHTTLDARLQQVAEQVMTDVFPAEEGPTGALAAVDPGSGRILALHSGTDFATEQFDVTTQGRRQPGSAFKPFVFAAALEQGVPDGTRLAGSTTTFRIPGHIDPWSVTNYGGVNYGALTLHEALVRSVNTAFAQLVLTVGPDAVANLAQRAGIDMQAATAGDVVPAIALGGFTRGVTPLEMASAYGVFAAGGTRAAPHLIDRVVAPGNTILHEHVVIPEQAMAPAVAAATVDVMQDVVRHGTGQRAQVARWEPAGKTGTTQLHTDAWFIGFVPGLSAAVWMGHPEGQVPMGRMVGGSLPAQAWSRFMSEALAGVEPVPFPEGDGPLPPPDASRLVTVPHVAGLASAAALQILSDAHLHPSVRTVESTQPPGTVISQDPPAGTLTPPRVDVTVLVSVSPPPPPPEAEPQPEPALTEQPMLPRTPTPGVTPTPTPTPGPTLTPTPIPGPTPTPTPSPTPVPTPTPTADPG